MAFRIVLRAFVAAVPVNFAWEMAQMGAFTGLPADPLLASLACVTASFGDGLLILLVWAIGALVFRRVAWVRDAGLRGWLMLLATAVAVGIGVEVVFVHVLRKWGYREFMPIIPLVNVGLIPILLLPLLAPPVLWWASRPAR